MSGPIRNVYFRSMSEKDEFLRLTASLRQLTDMPKGMVIVRSLRAVEKLIKEGKLDPRSL